MHCCPRRTSKQLSPLNSLFMGHAAGFAVATVTRSCIGDKGADPGAYRGARELIYGQVRL